MLCASLNQGGDLWLLEMLLELFWYYLIAIISDKDKNEFVPVVKCHVVNLNSVCLPLVSWLDSEEYNNDPMVSVVK